MRVVIPPKSPENCINVSELHENHLIICYVDGKPKGFIEQDCDYCYEFRINASFDDYYHPKVSTCSTIPELIDNILKVYPEATFEAYE